MATIVNIRGTGGSGKTYAVNYVIKKLGIRNKIIKNGRPHYRPTNNVVGYRLNKDVLIVGKYDTDCGGTDQIKTQDEIMERICNFAKKGSIVIFEGLLVSGLYSRYRDLSKELQKKGHKYIWIFLDTTLEVCCKRTMERRRRAGNNKPFNSKNTELKYRAVELAKQHALEDGERVLTFSHKRAHKQLYSLVKKQLRHEKDRNK